MRELYENYRPLLFSIAYQMMGSVSDAEDAVQDVFVKLADRDLAQLKEPKSYLCKMVSNRCLDMIKSTQRQREQYFGPWLPEPIETSAEDTAETVVRGELLSYAMLVLLERLSPLERAVFILREALGFEYPDIAELVEKTEVYCRKLFSRARAKMGFDPEMPIQPEAADEEWVHRFLSALEQGSMDSVLSLLSKDVVITSDGGGKASAAVQPIVSPIFVARFALGVYRKFSDVERGIQVEHVSLNGQPGLVFRSPEGIEGAMLLHVEGDRIRNLYIVRNPDKLQHL